MRTLKNLLRRFVPEFVLSWYHFLWAFLGALLYGFPARKMTVIGVTGTDGKSTTTEMITRIFKEAGYKTCSTSSVWFQIADKREKNHLKMGMPGRMFLQKFLRNALRQGCTHAVIEVSSEGILQNRHRFLNFHTAVITNLSPEHIERHGSFEKYRAEKQKLFRVAKKVHVVNADDENVEYFSALPTQKKLLYGIHNTHIPNTTYQRLAAKNIRETKSGTYFDIQDDEFYLQLIGQFNAYNALAATCVGLAHGISLDICKQALAKMPGMPGRTDVVVREPFTALIDYAITPKAFENLYKGVQRLFEPKKLICVFGAAGGGRDKWKRPLLGKIAASYCDEIILTNEDPYDEPPASILEEIEAGVSQNPKPKTPARSRQATDLAGGQIPKYKILDRREAIKKALSIAQAGDVVVVSGKGSEDAIAVAGGKKVPWDERTVIEEEFAKLYPSYDGVDT